MKEEMENRMVETIVDVVGSALKKVGVARGTVRHYLAKITRDNYHKKGIILPDPHLPDLDHRSQAAVNKFLATEKWDFWVCLGDVNDFDAISRFSERDLKKIGSAVFKEQYDASNRWLDEQVNIIRGPNPDADMHLIEGNHDARVHEYLKRNPQTEGYVEVPTNLRLDERKINWVPFWSESDILAIGKANFIHGCWVNEHHAAKHAKKFGVNVFYGHCFDEKTELLTDKGWLHYSCIDPYLHKAATYNVEKKSLEYNSINKVYRFGNKIEGAAVHRSTDIFHIAICRDDDGFQQGMLLAEFRQ